MKPSISVIIPTYNRAELLPRAINSVLNQTYQNFEIIIIDDKSTDNTKNIIKKFIEKDKRIKYFLNKHKKGPGGARNHGIEKAKGKYLAFLDDDDEWLLFHLKECLQFFKEFPECFIVFADTKTIKNNKVILNSSFKCKKQIHKIPTLNKNQYRKFTINIFPFLIKENFIPTQTIIIKKEFLNQQFDENIFNGQDLDLMLRLTKNNIIGYINKIHCNRYIHNKNIFIQSKDWKRIANENKKIWLKLLNSDITNQNKKDVLKNLSNVLPKTIFNLGYTFFLENNFQKAKFYYLKSLKHKITYKAMKGLLIISFIPHKFLIRYNKKRDLNG